VVPVSATDQTSCPSGRSRWPLRCPSVQGRAGSGRGSTLMAFTGFSGLPVASEQVDAIRLLCAVAARGAVAPLLRHPAGGLLGSYGSLFKGRRIWYRMAVAMIVIVVIRYALGWLSEVPRGSPQR
jgi:hypothetical protein